MRLHRRLILPLFSVAAVVSIIGTLGVVLLVRHTFQIALAAQARQLTRTTESVLNARGRDLDAIATVLAILDGPAGQRLASWKHTPVDAAVVLDRTGGTVQSHAGPAIDQTDLAALAAAAPASPVIVGDEQGLMIAAARPDSNHRTQVVIAASRLDERFVASLKELLQGDVELLVAGRTITGAAATAPGGGTTQPIDLPFRTAGGRAMTVRVHVPVAELVRAEHRAIAWSISGGTALLALALLLYGWTVEGALRDTQARLVHSAKLSTVGQLVAGVSHELNNPLLGLIGSAEQLADHVHDDDAGRPLLDLILKEAQRLKRILADLRGFVRPSSADRVVLDLNPLLRDVLGLVRHQATGANINCEIALSSEALNVSGSPDQLRQVFLNLSVNAVEAMPTGGTLRMSTARNGANRVVVSITDSGVGLSGDARDRATEPFFSTKPGRLGLGLAITRDIVEAHGGVFKLESAPGGGTAATVALPEAPA